MPFDGDLSCPDWVEKLKAGETPMPNLDIDQRVADVAVRIFDQLRLPDVAVLVRHSLFQLRPAGRQVFRLSQQQARGHALPVRAAGRAPGCCLPRGAFPHLGGARGRAA